MREIERKSEKQNIFSSSRKHKSIASKVNELNFKFGTKQSNKESGATKRERERERSWQGQTATQ